MIVSGEVWLGLEKLHQLTSARDYKLQVKMKDFDDKTYQAVYNHFEVFTILYKRQNNFFDTGWTGRRVHVENWRIR